MPRTIKAAGEMQIQEQARQTCDLNIECECRKILFANAPRPVFKAWRDTGESASFRVDRYPARVTVRIAVYVY